jgi:hypothetical protein
MNEQQSESLLDTLLSTEQDTDAAIIAEITKIRHSECSHSEMLNMLAALVRRTNHPHAIGQLEAFCVIPETIPNWTPESRVSTQELLKIAADLATSNELMDRRYANNHDTRIIDVKALDENDISVLQEIARGRTLPGDKVTSEEAREILIFRGIN